MSQPPEPDDPFADFLVAYDLLHTLGLALTPISRSSSNEPLDSDLAAELERSKACIDLLNQHWPRGDSSKVDGSAPAAKFLDYEIRSLIGAGGHGLVFLATDTSLRRDFALKVPRPEWLRSPSLRARFLREAQAVARLRHPGIVTIYYFGESGTVCYIAAQYINGPNLSEWLRSREGRCEPALAARLMRRLTDAVQHAHERGVLHRDLKPGNILLELTEDADWPVKPLITDFGLAKLLGEGGEQTRTGAYVLGSPGYMAPEQLSGGKIGPAADIYALGAILHTILVGRPPRADDRLGRVSELPEGLRQITARCLETDPGDRYPSVAALGAELDRFISGQPIRRRRLASVARFARRLGRGRAIGWLGAACLAALIALSAREFGRRPSATARSVEREAARRSEERLRRLNYTAGLRRAHELLVDHRFHNGMEQLEIARKDADPEDLSGFAWRYLKNYGDREAISFQGHEGDIYYCRFSPDGSLLATTGKDGAVRLWDMPGGKPAGTLAGSKSEVNWVAFSPDGATLAVTGDDTILRMWDVKTRSLLREKTVYDREVVAVEFHPKGKWLYTATRSGILDERDLTTLDFSMRKPAEINRLETMAVSPIDGSIAMPSKSSAISLIHFETDAKGQRRPTRTVEFGDESRKWNTNRIYSVAFSTDGNFIAAARADEEDYPISVWDMRTRKPIHTLTGHSDNVSSITVSPDSRILASGGKDQTVRLWDLASGKLIRTFTGHRTSIWSVAFSPKGRWLASTAADGTVKLWDCQSTPKQLPLRGTSRGFGPAVFSPDGHELRAAVEDGRLRDWSVETGAVLRQHDWILVENESLLGLSPDYRTLAYQTPEDGLWLLSIPANRRSKIVGGRFFGSPSFSANGAICVVSDNKSLVSIVDTERQRAVCRLQFTANQDAPSGVIPLMSPDGKFLAVQNEHEWLVWIYALAKNGASQQLLKTISAEYRPLCFSSDSATLAMASAGAVYLLDMRTFEFVKSIRSYSSAINKAAFSPDGRSLVFGLADRTVRVSDVVSGEELFTIRAHSHPIFSLALSPDANALLSYANGPGKPTEAILHRLIPGGLE